MTNRCENCGYETTMKDVEVIPNKKETQDEFPQFDKMFLIKEEHKIGNMEVTKYFSINSVGELLRETLRQCDALDEDFLEEE